MLYSLLAVVAVLQTAQASVSGVVRDADSGAPLGGVEVALQDLDRTARTDPLGRYELRGVPAGPQHVAVRRLGYASANVHALVPAGGSLEINFALLVEPIEVTGVEVTGVLGALGPPSPEVGLHPDRSESPASIWSHPLLSEPDVFEALRGGLTAVDPEAPTGLHVRGGSADQTGYVLDGVPVFSPYHGAGLFSAWNPDALTGVALISSFPAAGLPAALSGTVAATTKIPGRETSARGSLSTDQGRVTVEGPLGAAGYLFAFQQGFASPFAPADESEYLRGESGDHLAKVQVPIRGGWLTVLSYGAESEFAAAAAVPDESPGPPPAPNQFEWEGRSLGLTWTHPFDSGLVRAQVWSASSVASSQWRAGSGPTALEATRSDAGAVLAIEGSGPSYRAAAGLRADRIRTDYGVGPASGEADARREASLSVPALFGSYERTFSDRFGLEASGALSAAVGRAWFAPSARAHWTADGGLSVWGSYARTHQFAQSLRNEESLAGHVFPADLFVGAGGDVPVARGQLGVLAVEWSLGGARFQLQGYSRASEGVVLPSATSRGPFSQGDVTTGSSSTKGVALDASVRSARYAATARYGWQDVLASAAGTSYSPAHGTEHLVDAGISFFPSATLLLRMAANAGFGRRSTASRGPFEWEACNLLDRGCEFAGAPELLGPLGGESLPAYVRIDVGARKHWHFRMGSRDSSVALFGTLTNVFGRSNVLTEFVDPVTGERTSVDMRPFSPLVVGIDWSF